MSVDVSPGVGGSPDAPPRGAVLQIDPLPDSAGLRVIGEISVNTRTVWQQTLKQLVERRTDVLHVDLSRVRFVDVAGVTDLAVTVQRLPAGQRIVLHRPPAQLPRILELFWPGLAAIEVAA
ncbi:STAS domain-containing protein [Streptomyces collinus]|uniref:STAS domain-containing protein n=1 Tax=Streptomyces collinus TaxID=42684 RepID=UPI00294377D2|nr:STAS domain-containing protein [Streptomyces collinus]